MIPLTPLEPWIARKIGASRLARGELEAYQLARLRETLLWAASHSRFYGERLAGARLELASLSELAALPFTTAEEIRADALRFVCVSQGEIERVVTLESSGTTGPPKRLYFTAEDQELTVDFFQVGMSTFTEPGDRVLILLPCARLGSVGELLARALARMGAAGLRHGPVTDVPAALAVMAREGVSGVVGTPTQVLALARWPAPPPGLGVRSALLTTDHVPRAVVAALQEAWGCAVYNHYGTTEMGLGGGVDCAARRGLHLREADLLVEVVEVRTGQPLPEGAEGEIVFTTLTRRGMPLIRYRTGDLGRFLPGPCRCGTVLRTLAHVRQRREAVAELAPGTVLALAELDEALLALPGVVDYAAEAAPGRLALTLATHRQDSVVEARAALLALPAVAQAVASGSVQLELRAVAARAPSPAKRAYNDGRLG